MEPTALAKHSISSLMRRVSSAGFKRPFVREAVLPDWWDEACEQDADLLPDVEIRVARFLGVPLDTIRDPRIALAAPRSPAAQLRRVRDIDKDRVAPAIHAALRIAGAVIRNLKPTAGTIRLPPKDALAWRREWAKGDPSAHSAAMLADLWGRGIPVLHVEVLPSPAFQGLACTIDDRPVIVVGHDLDDPWRIAFVAAHEVAHVVNGDCAPGQPVVDESDDVVDNDPIEVRADKFAVAAATGGASIPTVAADDFRTLAMKAAVVAEQQSIDPSAIVWAWARTTNNYSIATMAAKALYLHKGGKRVLRHHLDEHVHLEGASESDRALLRCLYGDPERRGGPH